MFKKNMMKVLRQVPRLQGESQREHRMRELFYLNIKWFMITLLTRKDRMSMANGLRSTSSFCRPQTCRICLQYSYGYEIL